MYAACWITSAYSDFVTDKQNEIVCKNAVSKALELGESLPFDVADIFNAHLSKMILQGIHSRDVHYNI